MRWRIYYEDGSTYSDRDGDAFHAPPPGVQVIAYEDPKAARGFALLHGQVNRRDSYYWKDEAWHICDQAGLWDYLLMYIGPKAILLGRTIRNEAFWEILHRAKAEGVG